MMACVVLTVRWLEEAHNHEKGLVAGLVHDAGLTPMKETGRYTTEFGTLGLIRAVKPVEGAGR